MHAHDNGNEEARQLNAAMQMLRLATELSTPRKPALKADDGQPRRGPGPGRGQHQPGRHHGARPLAVVDDAGALYPPRQRGAKRDGQTLSGELNTRWP